jgi:hypothetical protein
MRRQGATIAMHHRDGTLLARYPHVETMIGRNFKTGSERQQGLFGSDHETTRLVSPIDGQLRLVSSHALKNFPIVIIATAAVSEALTIGDNRRDL